jgi:hypothetical protein
MELNRTGILGTGHTLADAPRDLADIQLAHERLTRYGRFRRGLGASPLENAASAGSATDAFGFLEWTME